MKKLLSLVMVLFLGVVSIYAKPLDKFNEMMDSASDAQAKHYLEHLSSDIGAIMTGSSYGVSATLGLARIDLNIKLNTRSAGNEIMREEGTTQLYMPVINAAVGLFAGIDVLAKYGYFYDSSMIGAGLRYNVYDSSVPFIPSITVQGIYSVLNIDDNSNKVNNNNTALGAIASFPIPFVTPYVGVGWDRTNTEAKSSTKEGMSVSSDNFSYGFGVSISLFVISGSVGVTYNEGIPSYTFGLNAGF